MKLLVETKGDFQLVDLGVNQVLAAHRPSVVVSTGFTQDRTGRGQIRVLGEVTDEATDDDFRETWAESEGDRQLAIDAFLAEFSTEAVVDEGEPKPRRGKGKAKAQKPAEPAVPAEPPAPPAPATPATPAAGEGAA